jgi:hypothetical protein
MFCLRSMPVCMPSRSQHSKKYTNRAETGIAAMTVAIAITRDMAILLRTSLTK